MAKNTENYALDKVLMCAACEIAVYDYVSHDAAQKSIDGSRLTTKYVVQEMLRGSDFGKRHQQELIEVAAKEKEIDLFGATFKVAVLDVIAWAKNLDPGTSDYTATIWGIANRQPMTVTSREFGQVASMLMTYQRHLATRKLAYVGVVGDTIELDVKVTNIKSGYGNYGDYWIIKSHTPNGDLVNWFLSNSPDYDVDDKLKIRGTVKDHKEFRSEKWTKLNRVKVLSGFGSKVS